MWVEKDVAINYNFFYAVKKMLFVHQIDIHSVFDGESFYVVEFLIRGPRR